MFRIALAGQTMAQMRPFVCLNDEFREIVFYADMDRGQLSTSADDGDDRNKVMVVALPALAVVSPGIHVDC